VLADGPASAVVTKTTRAQKVFVLGSFFNTGNDSSRISAILHGLSSHRRLINRWSYANVKVWEFS
jgi:hypothetical protein